MAAENGQLGGALRRACKLYVNPHANTPLPLAVVAATASPARGATWNGSLVVAGRLAGKRIVMAMRRALVVRGTHRPQAESSAPYSLLAGLRTCAR